MNKQQPGISLGDGTRMAVKDLLHNRGPTLLLISLICFVCLPLMLLATLKGKYVEYVRREIISKTQAMRIEAAIARPSETDARIDARLLKEILAHKGVAAVVPHRVRLVLVAESDGELAEYYAVSTAPDDPDLVRYGFVGEYPQSKRAVILHKNHIAAFGLQADAESLDIVVTRMSGEREQRFAVRCQIAGYLTDGIVGNIYVPLALADDFENWRKGYAIPDLGLPPGEHLYEALGEPVYSRVAAYLPGTIAEPESIKLARTYALDYTYAGRDSLTGLHQYLLWHADGRAQSLFQWENIEDLFFALGRPLLVPKMPFVAGFQSADTLSWETSVAGDPIGMRQLVRGKWLGPQATLFDVLVPDSLVFRDATFPHAGRMLLAGTEVHLNVIGTTRNGTVYASPELLWRMKEFSEGKSLYDARSRSFTPRSQEPEYLIARVHAVALEDVEQVCEWLTQKGLAAESSLAEIKAMQQVSKLITTLIMLIGGTGLLAVVCAVIGIMHEAVSRKRKQIGIMRIMGISRRAIWGICVGQALIYGFCGYVAGAILQLGMARVLDTPGGHSLLGIPRPEPLFTPRASTVFLNGVILLVLCGLSGWIPARRAANIDPPEVLSE